LHENPSSGNRATTYRQTHEEAFRDFANKPKTLFNMAATR